MYRYVLATVSLCTITSITGLNKTIGGYVAKGYEGTVIRATMLSFKTGLVGITILVGFSVYSLINNNNVEEAVLFIAAAVYFYPFSLFSRYSSILAGLEKFNVILKYNIIKTLSLFISALLVVVVLKNGIVVYGVSQLILTSVLLTVFFYFSFGRLKNDRVDSGYFRHSVTVSALSIGSQIITPGIQLYLSSTLGSTELAFFVIGNRIPAQLARIIKPIMHPISIRLAKKSSVGYNKYVLKLIPATMLMGVTLYLVFFFGIQYLGSYVIDQSYGASIVYAKMLGLFIIFSPTYSLLNSYVVFEKKNKILGISMYVNQALTITGYFLFLGKYGIHGIAITNVIALMIQLSIIIAGVYNNSKDMNI